MISSKKIKCGECGAPMELRQSRYGPFYGCTNWPKCSGTHGAHPNGAPLGKPADKQTKLARIAAHDAFERYWHTLGWHRGRAYKWLTEQLEIDAKECHIGRFDVTTCEKVIAICRVIPPPGPQPDL